MGWGRQGPEANGSTSVVGSSPTGDALAGLLDWQTTVPPGLSFPSLSFCIYDLIWISDRSSWAQSPTRKVAHTSLLL